jgi:hypothetical protein
LRPGRQLRLVKANLIEETFVGNVFERFSEAVCSHVLCANVLKL